jgi:hypothetical protein
MKSWIQQPMQPWCLEGYDSSDGMYELILKHEGDKSTWYLKNDVSKVIGENTWTPRDQFNEIRDWAQKVIDGDIDGLAKPEAEDKLGDNVYTKSQAKAVKEHLVDILPDSDGWIEHVGDECPVGPAVRVCIRLIDNYSSEQPSGGIAAGLYSWEKRGDDTITHYKIVEEAPKESKVDDIAIINNIYDMLQGRVFVSHDMKDTALNWLISKKDELLS